jgi:histidyl-tRNA synthetase
MNAVGSALLELGFSNFSIALNHRVILRSMIGAAGIDPSLEGSALIAIDKLDKIGVDGVQAELTQRGITQESAHRLLAMTTSTPEMSNHAVLEALRGQLLQPEAQQALNEIETLMSLTMDAPAGPHIRLAPALARGLSYYTGPIFEAVSTDFSGSLGGGGRYDNLVGMFSNKQVPAVGFSLGLERILLLMEERQMFPALQLTAQVMVCVLPDTPLPPAVGLASRLRQAGITVEVYPEQSKLKRQLSAADTQQIPYALILGPDEVERRRYTLKDLATGKQQALGEDDLIAALRPRTPPQAA